MTIRRIMPVFAISGALALMLTLASHHSAYAVGSDPQAELSLEPDYRLARQHIDERRFAEAIPLLMQLRTIYADVPHVANWLGYAHRKLKDYPASKIFYDEALKLDPAFMPALEYQGEWYIETGDMAAAEANLAKLVALCAGCHETQDLQQAIAKAKASR